MTPSTRRKPIRAGLYGLVGLSLGLTASAAEPLYTTTTSQGGSDGTTWAASVIWFLNGGGTAAGAAAGNTYECLANGTAIGNATGNTRIRPPYSSGTATIATFPGDSLILTTNTEMRVKELSTSGTSAQGLGYAAPTNNFPGANGLIGLVLNGGMLNTGDSYAFTILGTMQAAPGSISYLNPGNTLSGDGTKRGLIIASQLSGSGGIALLDGNVAIPQIISGKSNTFTGTWIVKSGWLQGAGDGTQDGYNSLGTNTAVVFRVDPNWGLPSNFGSSAVVNSGPSVLDLGSAALANCGGTLILTNGGALYLHGNAVFSSVVVEGVSIPRGIYSYATLVSQYNINNNFTPAGFAAGSGTLTVQPYGPPPPLTPSIAASPVAQVLYPGGTAQFIAAATGLAPLSYHWQKNNVNLAGATNTTLIISNVAAGDAASYQMVVSNPGGSATTTPAALTLIPLTEPYAQGVVAASPVAFYELNDPAPPNTNAYDSFGGFVGTYGTQVTYGPSVPGPSSTLGFPGFTATQQAGGFTTGFGGSLVTVPAFNLGTNGTNVTISAWINPAGPQGNGTGIFFCRAGTTVAGLCYTPFTDASGNATLGYNWNNDENTWDWNSELVAPQNQWSFVSVVVTPTEATIYLMNANGVTASTQVWNHPAQAFDGISLIGDDSLDGGNGSRAFNGSIADVAIFNSALSKSQLIGLYATGSGVTNFPPVIGAQPVSINAYPGQTAVFDVPSSGSDPLSYQWMAGVGGSGVFTNLVDGGEISGSLTPILTISPISAGDTADLELVITNSFGSVTSVVATLNVQATGAAEAVTMSTQEAAGADWDTLATTYWSDGNPVSLSAYAYPGTTYELLAGARLRTPANTVNSVFEGQILTVDGTGVLTNNPAAGAPSAEIRFKEPSSGSTVTISNLVMNGGQLDLGIDGVAILEGLVNILTNTPMYVDSAGDANRQLQINSQIIGSASIEWAAFDSSLVGELIINCPSNTYSGTWQVDQGLLVGAAANSLGTNTITVLTNGTLWTWYGVTNPAGALYLSGKLLLNQNDTFHNVVVGTAGLAPGTYTFNQLTSLYQTHFPTNWTGVANTTNVYAGSGSLTVLAYSPIVITTQPVSVTNYPAIPESFSVAVVGGGPFTYQWKAGAIGSGVYTNLTDGGVISGSATATLTISAPQAANAADYVVVVSNPGSSVTSQAATLALLATGAPIIPITLTGVEAIGQDWNTTGEWNDGMGGLPASISAYEFPGSTYVVEPGALLRTPALAATTFPGQSLTLAGDGVWENGYPTATPTLSEMRFKQLAAGNTVTIGNLVMAGGQLGFGADGYVVLNGGLNVVSNAPIYVDAGGDNTRWLQLNSFITGAGSIEYHAWDTTFVDPLIVGGTNNAFSGTWNQVEGLLVGNAPGALGTPSANIVIGANASLFTIYPLVNTNGSLVLNGQMLLNQNDVFASVSINGTALATGIYTFNQLTNLFPTNFPTFWTGIAGTGASYNGSGSINVGNYVVPPPPPVTLYIQPAGTNVVLTWSAGTLLQATTAGGAWTTNTATSPYTNPATATQMYYRVRVK